jgi:hypothetical protein
MKFNEPFVKVINPLQFKLYMKHGVKPIDMYYNPSSDRVIFIYKNSDTQELYKLWNERRLK